MGEHSKMNVGVAGCGAIAREHLGVLRSIGTLDVVALCDIDKETVSRTSREWSVSHCYTDFSEMLEKEDISIVSILTPPQTHASMAIQSIHRGINVLVEKPLTMSSGEAELIREALKGSTVRLTVDYNLLWNNSMLQALALVRKSGIGQVIGMEVRMLHTTDDPMASNEKHWCHKLPGGRFGEMLAHPVYLLQAVLGDNLDVINVLAQKRGSIDWMPHDELYVLLRGIRGIGRTYVSFNAPRPAYLIDIYGTEKMLNIDPINGTLLMRGYRTLSKTDSAIDCLSIAGQMLFQTIRNTMTYLRQERGHNTLRRAYISLVDSIEDRGELVVNADLACNTVRIVEEICRAI
jgi:predicted dehydrogenase